MNKILQISAISEHWLHTYELNQLSTFHKNFSFHGSAHPPDEDPLFCRPRLIRERGGRGGSHCMDQVIGQHHQEASH